MAGLLVILWDRCMEIYGTEEPRPQLIEERQLSPKTQVCNSHTRLLTAAADRFETLSVERRDSQSMMMMDPVNTLKTQVKVVKHQLVRLNSFQRKEFSKEFGGELRRLGDLFDKDPNVRKKLNPQDESDGIKLRRAADEFDLLFGKPTRH